MILKAAWILRAPEPDQEMAPHLEGALAGEALSGFRESRERARILEK